MKNGLMGRMKHSAYLFNDCKMPISLLQKQDTVILPQKVLNTTLRQN